MRNMQSLRPSGRLVVGILLVAAMILIAACQPIVDPALLEDQGAGSAANTEPMFEVEPARATINAQSLRVRSGPADSYDLVAGVRQGETFDVLAMSSDGAWIQLAVERAEDGQGWVSTEFVTLEGDITNIATVPAEEPAEEADAEPSETAEDTAVAVGAEDAEDSQEPVSNLAVIGQALIETPLPLRVRSEPTDAVDNKIGSVYNLETYPVLDISEDGQWILIDVPKFSDTGGWVWWENVVLSGDIADQLAAESGDMTDDTGTEESGTEESGTVAEASETEAVTEAESPTDEATSEPASVAEASEGAAEALIVTPLPLRVRSEPTDAVDNKIGNVFDGETYPVLETSADGLWVKIDVPQIAEDGGWVSTEYVQIQG